MKKHDKKSSAKTSEEVTLGFDIQVASGPILKPTELRFWPKAKVQTQAAQAPLHYMSDALVGLSFIHLNDHLKNPFLNPGINFSFCHDAWLAVEPHYELYQRCQTRVGSIRNQLKKPAELDKNTQAFEKTLNDILHNSISDQSMDLTALTDLIDAIDFFENKMNSQLLYNFAVHFSRGTVDRLHHLHSLLFNLRAVIALDHNSHTQDSAFESVKVDSITDYLSKAEYVTNDSLIYWHFKKSAQPNDELEKAFKQYNHNGYCLIESLPEHFLNSVHKNNLEETLYLVQMDWLLGTAAGLLFKIREELYGLKEGYEKVFWPDIKAGQTYAQSCLSVCCKLSAKQIFPDSNAA